MKRFSLGPHLIFIVLCLLITTTACGSFGKAFKGETVKPLTTAPNINLPDQNGNPFQLADQQGKVTLVFFGFTNCVDECPTTLAHIKLALGMLDQSTVPVQVVLVSTDPIRDTPQALQAFLLKFDPAYLGITGPLPEMQKIWDGYQVVVLDGGETHSSFVYVIDQQGNLRLRFEAETSPEDMASDLNILLVEK